MYEQKIGVDILLIVHILKSTHMKTHLQSLALINSAGHQTLYAHI